MIHPTLLRVQPIFSKAAWLCAGLMLAACGPGAATPMPEPPSFLRGGQVSPSPAEVTVMAPSTIKNADFVGAPGSAPAGAIVYLTNLDSQNQVVASNVQADGSFTIGATIQSGDELRFIVVNGGKRSTPFDARYESTPEATLTPSVRLECLSIEPGPTLDFKALSMSTLELFISNFCGVPVVLENARLRVNLPDYLVDGNSLPTVAIGSSAVVSIKFSPKQAGLREDVLFFDAVLGATRVRYAVSLFGE